MTCCSACFSASITSPTWDAPSRRQPGLPAGGILNRAFSAPYRPARRWDLAAHVLRAASGLLARGTSVSSTSRCPASRRWDHGEHHLRINVGCAKDRLAPDQADSAAASGAESEVFVPAPGPSCHYWPPARIGWSAGTNSDQPTMAGRLVQTSISDQPTFQGWWVTTIIPPQAVPHSNQRFWRWRSGGRGNPWKASRGS